MINIIGNIISTSNSFQGEGELTFDSSVTTLESNIYRVNSRAPINQILFSRSIVWNSGKTYLTYRHNISASHRAKAAVAVYDEHDGYLRHIVMGGSLTSYSDEHPHPVLMFKNNKIYAFQEQPHNTPLRILKSRADNDVSGGFDQLVAEVGNTISYSNMVDNGTYIGNWYRAAPPSDYDGYLLRTTDIESWSGGGNMVLEFSDFAGFDRVYPSAPFNNKVGNWFYFEAVLRNDATENKWGSGYVFKTQDFQTVYSVSEDYSRDLTLGKVSGANANSFLRYHTLTSTQEGYKTCSAVSPSGNFYAIRYDGSDNPYFFRVGVDGTDFSKAITGISDLTVGQVNTQDSAFVMMIARSDSDIRIFVRRQPGTYRKIYQYKTVDQGNTWSLVGEVGPTINAHINYIGLPFNALDIPDNRNFVCYLTEENTNTPVHVKVYAIKAAWGTVQSETPNTYTAYTSLTDAGTPLFAYEIAAGKVTTSGTTLTGMTDQSSSARAVTIFGSPVVDNGTTPTYLTFDGVNDRIELNTTNLTGLTQFTYYFVGRKRTSQTTAANAGFLTFSNSGSATEGIFLGLSNASNKSMRIFRASSTAEKAVTYEGTANYNDDTFRVFAITVDQGKQWQMFAGGSFEDLNYVSGDQLAGGQSPADLTTNTVAIGALVRSAIGYYQFDFRAGYLYSGVHTYEKMKRQTAFLTVRNGL